MIFIEKTPVSPSKIIDLLCPLPKYENTLIYIGDPQWTSGVAIEGELSAG